jgi:hypothetical protein
MANPDPTSFRTQANQKQQSALGSFATFVFQNKKWWLTPIILLLVLVSALILLGGSGVAPFIYSLF